MSSTSSTGEQPASSTPGGFIAFAWALVGIPLVYGLYNTVKAASALFTG
ncbi:hypothetical protein QOZ88_01320 [Blastococcus sp. BMG 814]|uniref:Oxalate:formate antiporter n=1 Tax=Blastococcus carthaginiensis TaxID=3050034 RepID=A0ABT9I6U0_9ACTN|nr:MULTISPECIES: hypothetical protein [Blastococcus]MDP5181268.1 hypothetical protein [Blastococcus carthaginiensis]SEK88010.1 hypothetical protein SAMN04515665_10622 [Blastococcus sp. DSM 46786]